MCCDPGMDFDAYERELWTGRADAYERGFARLTAYTAGALLDAAGVTAGTRLDVEARYDNSASNPNNPNRPPRTVTYGEETTNEMCFVFLGGVADQAGGRALPIRPKGAKQK